LEKEKEEKELPLDQTNVRPKALNVFGLKNVVLIQLFKGGETHTHKESEREERKRERRRQR
jgi:hypothetical protein